MQAQARCTSRGFALGLAAVVLGLVASPLMAATTINVTCAPTPGGLCTGTNLNQIMENALDGDTVSVGPGTYPVMATTFVPADKFRIRRSITVKSTGGPSVTTLQASGGSTDYAVYFHAMVWSATTHSPNGATLDGFTITGAKGGVEVQDYQTATGGVTDNVTLKNLVVNIDASASGSHGVSFANVTNSKIDTVTVVNAYNNGIYVFQGSNNVIINNTVQNTVVDHGHAIAISNTTNAIVAGNTVTGSGFHAIIALGSTNSRIERNVLSGYRYDGVTVTYNVNTSTSAASNLISHNRMASSGWGTSGIVDGTGIFLNGPTNGNLLYGNDMRGSPENGMALFSAGRNLIEGNRIHGNYQGGILIWKLNPSVDGSPVVQPTDNYVRNNFIYYNPTNGMVNLRDTLRTDIAWNYLSGSNFAGDPANPPNQPNSATPVSTNNGGVTAASFPSASTAVYENSLAGLSTSFYFDTSSTAATVFRNRQFGTMAKYSNAPATVAWDGGSLLGGNFWSDFSVSGNPSNGSTPYTDIYCPTAVGCAPTYQDRYPFASERLNHYPSVAVILPRAGAAVSAGSTKTVRWDSEGCIFVDIDLLNSGGTPVLSIVSNYPDVGMKTWDVPSGQAAGTYSVRVTCKNSGNASLGVAGTSGNFTIAAAGLKLVTAAPYWKETALGSMTVAFTRGAGVTGTVTVFTSVDGASEISQGTTTGNFLTFTTPNANSNRVYVRIVTGANQDSTDGWFSIVSSAGEGFTNPPSGQGLVYGSKARLEWKSKTNSRYVDLQYFDGSSYQFIAQNVPDFGHFDWLVPASIGSGRTLRIIYKSAVDAVLSTITTAPFSIVNGVDLSVQQTASVNPGNVGKDVMYTMTVGNDGPITATSVTLTDTLPAGSTYVWGSPGCSNAAGTVTCAIGTLTTGTGAVVKVVVRPGSAGTATNNVSVTSAQSDPLFSNNSSSLAITVNTTPAATQVLRYRLYSDVTKEHHFTTDLNEYTVLDATPSWVGEGTVGKVLNNPGSFGGVTAVPYYRLYNTDTQWHHWTTDVNEYYTLIGFPGWIGEGVDGYILPSSAVGATQLYRLNYPALGSLHHWTIDANEYNTLITSYGWVGEGGSGFVIQ